MFGTEQEERGVVPRACESLFQRAEFMEQCGWKVEMQAAFSEVYMENIYDLLDTEVNKSAVVEVKYKPI